MLYVWRAHIRSWLQAASSLRSCIARQLTLERNVQQAPREQQAHFPALWVPQRALCWTEQESVTPAERPANTGYEEQFNCGMNRKK